MKKSEYELQAEEFLQSANAQMRIIFLRTVIGFPWSDDQLCHNKYQVVITREGKSYDFPFYDSFEHCKENKDPTPYDILACVEKYEVPDNMWEFSKEYGYEINSEESYNRVYNIWRTCKEQYEALSDLFGAHMYDLQCIS